MCIPPQHNMFYDIPTPSIITFTCVYIYNE